MSGGTWIVDPDVDWIREHQYYLPEANLPDTPRCKETLSGAPCELVFHVRHVPHVATFSKLPQTFRLSHDELPKPVIGETYEQWKARTGGV